MPDYLKRAEEIKTDIISRRRDFHRHPELLFQEVRTAAVVARHLKDLGIGVKEGVAQTGVVGEIGTGGRLVALRADMDALPIEEENQADYCSQNPGVMHACGHDAHTACLLSAATLLAEDFRAGRLQGRVRFLFQPAEEKKGPLGKSGGEMMVEAGALEGVAAVLGLHVISTLESNAVFVREGPLMAAMDSFEARVLGRGGHGAMPHEALDPIWLAAQVINAIQGVVARRKSPVEPGLITVGAIHAGTTTNVIPSEAAMMGTIRSFSEETRKILHRELENAFALTRAFGGDYQLNIQQGYPVTVNHPAMARFVRTMATGLLGPARVREADLQMGAEDFSFMARAVPGCFFYLGAKKDAVHRPHHAPNFDIDEQVLPTAAALMAQVAHQFLTASQF